MRRFYSTFVICLVALAAMAQGWPANYKGVMLQGFYWDSFDDTQWTRLENQADDLAKVFDLVWIPQSGYCGGTSMGYDDLWWFNNYNSSFGNETQLRSMINTFKEKGIGTIADVVINHRRNVSNWVDFPKETYKDEVYEMTSTDICANDDDGATKNWATTNGYSLSSNNDTGEGWGGMRDLDHKSANVQRIVKAYLKFLLNDLGYTGFRYDMVKGYSAAYTKMYNEDSTPQFSVGECWDATKVIRDWIDGTGKTSAAFDFQFRYTVRNAINGNNWTKLGQTNGDYKKDNVTYPNYPLISNNYENASYSQYAVTFVENHDTEKRANAEQDPIKKDTLAANAYLLAMPGTPCVFLTHWKAYKQEIANMITVRKAVGITNTSAYQPIAVDKDYYVVQTTGANGKLLAVVGTKASSYAPSGTGWKKAISGYHYVYYVSDIDPATINYPEMHEEQEPAVAIPEFCTIEEDEVCAFFEAPATWTNSIYCWAWTNSPSDNFTYANEKWPGVECVKLGNATNGNAVWKWIWDGTKQKNSSATKPAMIIFSNNGAPQTADFPFANGGYYTKDGLKGTVTPTGIRAIESDIQGLVNVYTLDGRLVKIAAKGSEALNGLPKGVYIVNKKKFIVE